MALSLAYAGEYDVVLLQEPWVSSDSQEEHRTITHPAYDTYSPCLTWEEKTRPRVMTYLSRRGKLTADQLCPLQTRDALWIQIGDLVIVNFYRDAKDDTTTDFLLQWSIPNKCVIAGDFNSRHSMWQSADTYGRGNDIAAWSIDNALTLLNPHGVPTNPHGNTIDLAFSNIPSAEATVEDHLHTTSDHFTLAITIPTRPRVPAIPTRKKVDDDDRYLEALTEGVKAIDPSLPTDIPSLERRAKALIALFKYAIDASCKTTRRFAPQAPWWTLECAEAHLFYTAMRRVSTHDEIRRARIKLRKITRRAKRDYWRKKTEDLRRPDDIFKITQWTKGASQFRPPPLEHGGKVHETQLDRAEALREAILERCTSDDDISNPWEGDLAEKILINLSVTYEEAKDAATCAGNTSPGSDNITVDLLKMAWPVVGELVRQLYEQSILLGHYPECLKHAEVVMIPKVGKRDLSSPGSWRPISLLSCLGKGLERLLARRIAFAAIEHGILHPNQLGALPKRSALDLACALTHIIEQALQAGKVVTVAIADITGAFDATMKNRLVLRLRQQGWPAVMARWVLSFMTDRSATIRLQETLTEGKPLNCGLPQGSPISPILYLLYTQPIPFIGNERAPGTRAIKSRYVAKPAQRFGYADDTAMIRIGDTLEETAALATMDLKMLIDWGAENAISFNHKKTEVMHFSRKHNNDNPPIYHGDIPKRAEKAMRWLGVWFDRKLSFKEHVEKWTTKATKISNLLRRIANTQNGPPPEATRKAVKACVEPTLLYGSEVWYRGRNEEGSIQGTQYLLDRMHKTYMSSLRATAPVWKTTPLPAIYRESGLPPLDILIESHRRRFAARLQSIDSAHPLVQHLKPPDRGQTTRLQRTADLLPRSPRPLLLPRTPPSVHLYPSKETAAASFLDWQSQLPRRDLVVFSDGSMQDDGSVGFGYAIYRDGKKIRAGYEGLKSAEVYDAEVMGALAGLKRALITTTHPVRIHVCLDNVSVLEGLRGRPGDSSQAAFLEFQKLAKAHKGVGTRWCPGHTGIEGNEEADGYAKKGCSKEPLDLPPTLAFIRRIARAKTREEFSAWWATNMPEAYIPLGLKADLRCPKELTLPRTTLHHLLAARTQHGDFANYHERFNHPDAETDCSCGRRKNAYHIFYCRKVAPHERLRLAPSSLQAIHKAIGTNFKDFAKLAKGSSFFTEICPRRRASP
ncbi:reverse transcriptase [Fusarium albosuccineum]|uniref:Reverse transcriptase n=1 Tax=Fusarium albosuccineum TaxID=1237068 RepID=A0A8H4LNU6_9HYPO|nr:reverse transcriptase [Fusarium albosuccineum]